MEPAYTLTSAEAAFALPTFSLPPYLTQSTFEPFPHVEEVIKLVEVNKPDQQFRQLLDYLLEAGITSSEELGVVCVGTPTPGSHVTT